MADIGKWTSRHSLEGMYFIIKLLFVCCCILSIFLWLYLQNLTKIIKFMCFCKFDPSPTRHKLACKLFQGTFNFKFQIMGGLANGLYNI